MSSKRYIVRRMRMPMRKECGRSIEEECLDRRLASVNLGRQCPNTLRSSILTGIIKDSGRAHRWRRGPQRGFDSASR